MRLQDSETRDIIRKVNFTFRDKESKDLLLELTNEFYFDEFLLETIKFVKKLGLFLQYMIECENKKIVDILDDAVYRCDFDDCVTSEHRRLAIKLLISIWAYGEELETATNSDCS